MVRTSWEDFSLFICEFREFLDSEIVDIEIKVHLSNHTDRREITRSMPCCPYAVCIAEMSKFYSRCQTSDITQVSPDEINPLVLYKRLPFKLVREQLSRLPEA